jgi:FlaA1/EpsC-like NDP-sugar epimerase
MKRYFMAPSEAVLLVLEAAALGEGGEAYVLDMGEPVRIVDLAREMIRLSGHEPDVDIPIIYSGLRPGEKLFEEILGAEEGSEPTKHSKIYKVRNSGKKEEAELLEKIDRLMATCRENGCRDEIVSCLKEIVPTYVPDTEVKSINQW